LGLRGSSASPDSICALTVDVDMSNANKIKKVQSPALPLPPADNPVSGYLGSLNNITRLFFNQLANSVNLLTGTNGGVFISNPNGLFFDTADQPIAIVNTAQPVRFNQTYLNNGVSINGATTSEITVANSGVYNFQFTGQLRSNSGASKILFVWLNRNGTNVGYSTREYSISGSGKELDILWSFNIDLLAGQYIQVIIAGDSTDLSLDAVAATSPHPGISSAVVAVTFVSALPETLPILP
jgi:hypothetical protein